SGLFLAILTVAVALFFDRFLLAPGTWDAFSGGVEPWRPPRPSIAGIGLGGSYTFYLFVLAVFLVTTLLVWNLRRGKVGRVLQAIRGSELAAATMGLDLTVWKLAAFGVSAGLAGLAGGLSAVAVGSVSAGSYDFLHSVSVSVRFGGVQALAEVSLTLTRGAILGPIGPNGAGKTTLFNCLSGVQRPSSGRVRFEGRPIDGLKPNRRARLGLARTFQNLQLFSDLTVLENLMVPVDAFSPRGPVADGLRLPRARIEERRADERARAVLHFLGIGSLATTPAGGLPVGLQRRVELGRALCLRPKLLLLDEPAAGLDAGETAGLAALLSRVPGPVPTSI